MEQSGKTGSTIVGTGRVNMSAKSQPLVKVTAIQVLGALAEALEDMTHAYEFACSSSCSACLRVWFVQ